MKVYITSPRGKERLVEAFGKAPIEVSRELTDEVRLIVPTVDEELPFFSRAREWFRNKDVTVACASDYTIDTCRDKAEFYRFCRRHDFDVPATAQFEAIIKPRFGKGSRGQIRIDRSYILQEVIHGEEYSIDYFKLGDTISIIPRKRLNVVNGESQAAKFDDSPILIEEARRMGEELKLEYHNVMQCFFDGAHIKWIEVNPRYGGGSWLTFDRFNSPKFLVNKLGDS